MWERGLKHLYILAQLLEVSRSPCGSVDWNLRSAMPIISSSVAPHVGAWIETLGLTYGATPSKISRSPCGSVDWNIIFTLRQCTYCSRSPCGSVDWNLKDTAKGRQYVGRSPCGSVDWNSTLSMLSRCIGPSLPMWERGLKQFKRPRCQDVHRRSPCWSVDWNIKDDGKPFSRQHIWGCYVSMTTCGW